MLNRLLRFQATFLACLMVVGCLLGADAVEAKKKKKKETTMAKVSGVVNDANEKKVRDARVVLVRAETGETVGETKTSKKGEFEIELDVAEAAGTYTVKVYAEGSADFNADVELNAGDNQSFTITMMSVEVQVNDAL